LCITEKSMKDHYLVLGISSKADDKGIRDAFRRLAKECHPDKAGPEGCDYFRNVLEAYETLSDADRRKIYDQNRRGQRPPATPSTDRSRTGPSFGLPHQGRNRGPFQFFSDELLNRLPNTSPPPKNASLDYELVLSEEEAVEGISFEIPVPVAEVCPFCAGRGGNRLLRCAPCSGKGILRENRIARIRIPPGIPKNGCVMQVPLPRGALGHGNLRFLIRIES
jgi:molecular chaperone DnaJ